MTYLNISQILISVLIIAVILMQVRESGGGVFGGPQGTIRSRRGLEKVMFQFTIILAVLFLIVSIISVRLS
ncbi:MAG TPA: preprotein translocase subunit SecG [Dehalococcoidia bacterium]|jgi:preprotein translocase subunit SecG|nr:preprotein translocase subunit SecG [Dehalococcoidia bacterium]